MTWDDLQHQRWGDGLDPRHAGIVVEPSRPTPSLEALKRIHALAHMDPYSDPERKAVAFVERMDAARCS